MGLNPLEALCAITYGLISWGGYHASQILGLDGSTEPHWHPTVYEDPDQLGYSTTPDPMLEIMPREEWNALEAAALEAGVV